MKKGAEVLVVHCVDTEGPIGGNVRRRPDGSAEFMDSWPKIERSIRRLTSMRRQLADSFGRPYIFNWFIMDFTGFKTNPKKRVAAYNDTYDHFKSFPTLPDAFYWHYHHPVKSGAGDQWSDSWHSSQEYRAILLHRLVEREDWPEAFRAGGTIEDNAASLWLEDTIMVDYSNRVSAMAEPTKNIFDFNWYGSPHLWGYYHPSRSNFLKPGKMRRFIVRCVDAWSRLHVLTVEEVREAFQLAQKTNRPIILSFFSHDHRDMINETLYAVSLIRQVALETGVAWSVYQALPALQRAAGIKPVRVRVTVRRSNKTLRIEMNRPIYQPRPWVGARMRDGSLAWLPVTAHGSRVFEVEKWQKAEKIVIGGTSASGNKFVHSL